MSVNTSMFWGPKFERPKLDKEDEDKQTNKSPQQTFYDKSVDTSCQNGKKIEKKNYNFFAFKSKKWSQSI